MIDWREHIESDSNKLFGKPVIKNTRIPVDLLLEKLAKEETVEELLEAYPRINPKAIFAVFAYAAAFIRNENIY